MIIYGIAGLSTMAPQATNPHYSRTMISAMDPCLTTTDEGLIPILMVETKSMGGLVRKSLILKEESSSRMVINLN